MKRPDIAWMFHRRDLFVALDGLEFLDNNAIVINDDKLASGKAAELALANEMPSLDDCILWIGMPVVNLEGTALGNAESVLFDQRTGDVETLVLSAGATANTILGHREIPADLIKGYNDGAILVASEAAEIEPSGGIAERAGAASAVATDKTKRTYKKVVRTVGEKVGETDENASTAKVAKAAATKAATKAASVAKQKVGEKVSEKIDTEALAEKAASAPEKGGFAVGRQIARAGGMFGDFKREFDRAMNEDDDDER